MSTKSLLLLGFFFASTIFRKDLKLIFALTKEWLLVLQLKRKLCRQSAQCILRMSTYTHQLQIVTNIATFKVYAYNMPDYTINKQLSYIHTHF